MCLGRRGVDGPGTSSSCELFWSVPTLDSTKGREVDGPPKLLVRLRSSSRDGPCFVESDGRTGHVGRMGFGKTKSTYVPSLSPSVIAIVGRIRRKRLKRNCFGVVLSQLVWADVPQFAVNVEPTEPPNRDYRSARSALSFLTQTRSSKAGIVKGEKGAQ